MISASIQAKKGWLYAVLQFKTKEGRYKQKWVAMHLKPTAKKKEQEEKLTQIRLEYSGICSVEALEISFADYIQKWNEETKASKSVTTYDGYCHMLNKYIYPYFKEKGYTLAELKPKDINAYYKWLQSDCGLSGNTALKHHQIIYTSLKYAVDNDLIRKNPCETVTRPRKQRAEHDFYNADELIRLLTVTTGDPLETVIYLTVWHGLRREETLGLKWSNVDFLERIIRINTTVVRAKQGGKLVCVERQQTKSETSNRVLCMSETVENYLKQVKQQQAYNKEMCGNCYTDSDYVCTNTMGVLIQPDYVTSRFNKVLKKNGLRHIRFHDIRHSTASFMLANGFGMKEIQEYLGHANFSFTADVYTHTDLQAKREMIDTISAGLTAD